MGNKAAYGAMFGAHIAGTVAGIAIPVLSVKKSFDEDRGLASGVAHFGLAMGGGFMASSLMKGPGVTLAGAIATGLK